MKNLPIRQFIQFAAVGLSGTAVQYASIQIAVMLSLSLLNKSPAVTGSAIGYLLGSVVNYILNYFLTFRSGKSHMEAASKYFTVLGVGWCINLGLMTLLVEHWHWWHWYAQILTTGLVLCWNFGGSKLWAFK
jgi:putative flippase GtrA